jgi:hypothetical protein
MVTPDMAIACEFFTVPEIVKVAALAGRALVSTAQNASAAQSNQDPELLHRNILIPNLQRILLEIPACAIAETLVFYGNFNKQRCGRAQCSADHGNDSAIL